MDKEKEICNELNCIRATQLRQWCTFVLRQFATRGYVIDNKRMSKRHIPMTMEDWAKRIDIILEATGDAVLTDAGKITAEFAKSLLSRSLRNIALSKTDFSNRTSTISTTTFFHWIPNNQLP